MCSYRPYLFYEGRSYNNNSTNTEKLYHAIQTNQADIYILVQSIPLFILSALVSTKQTGMFRTLFTVLISTVQSLIFVHVTEFIFCNRDLFIFSSSRSKSDGKFVLSPYKPWRHVRGVELHIHIFHIRWCEWSYSRASYYTPGKTAFGIRRIETLVEKRHISFPYREFLGRRARNSVPVPKELSLFPVPAGRT